MNTSLKKFLKHVLGKDLWLRPEVCVSTSFFGTRYGGWAVRKGSVNEDSIIYSFGIGEDASFDMGLISETGCRVHGFDPTPKSLDWVATNIVDERFMMHPWALGREDGILTLWLPDDPKHVSASLVSASTRSQSFFSADCRGLPSIMKELGHVKIDVLKMDIEGAEYGVIEELSGTPILSKVGQLLVEFHHRMNGFSKEQTLKAIEALHDEGFRIAWVSEVGHEVLFMRD